MFKPYLVAFYFAATKILFQPLPLLLLLVGLAVANLWRKRVESRRRLFLLTAPFLALMTSSVPAVVYPLLGSLKWQFPPSDGRPEGSEVIVVLSGGIKEPDATRRRPELTEDTTYRCLRAAELYHQGGALSGDRDGRHPGPSVDNSPRGALHAQVTRPARRTGIRRGR